MVFMCKISGPPHRVPMFHLGGGKWRSTRCEPLVTLLCRGKRRKENDWKLCESPKSLLRATSVNLFSEGTVHFFMTNTKHPCWNCLWNTSQTELDPLNAHSHQTDQSGLCSRYVSDRTAALIGLLWIWGLYAFICSVLPFFSLIRSACFIGCPLNMRGSPVFSDIWSATVVLWDFIKLHLSHWLHVLQSFLFQTYFVFILQNLHTKFVKIAFLCASSLFAFHTLVALRTACFHP